MLAEPELLAAGPECSASGKIAHRSFGSEHLITSEYPPQIGGVGDYTSLLATHLATLEGRVHVWCPALPGAPSATPGTIVHQDLGRFSVSDLVRAGRKLDQLTGPRRLLVQWVPHGYGYRSMNLPFCIWLWLRSVVQHDCVEVMVHEAYLPFGEGSWKQNLAAVVHRLMTIILLFATRKVWVAIPAWEQRWRPYSLGRRVDFRWLPVPSNVPVFEDRNKSATLRKHYLAGGHFLLGHFGTHGQAVTRLLDQIVPLLLSRCPSAVLLLIGSGSTEYLGRIAQRHPEFAARLRATAALPAADLSAHLAACDLLLQPYLDGISSRRASALAGLAHGVPVVTTEGHVTEGFWQDTGAIALVPAGDTGAFVDKCQVLLESPHRRFEIGATARKVYDGRFDVRHVVHALRQE